MGQGSISDTPTRHVVHMYLSSVKRLKFLPRRLSVAPAFRAALLQLPHHPERAGSLRGVLRCAAWYLGLTDDACGGTKNRRRERVSISLLTHNIRTFREFNGKVMTYTIVFLPDERG